MIYRWWRYVATHLLHHTTGRALDQYLLHRLPNARALVQTLLKARALFWKTCIVPTLSKYLELWLCGEMMCRRYIEGFVEECLKAPQTTNPPWDQACAVNSLHFLVEQLSLFILFGWDHFAAEEDFDFDGGYGGHKWKIHFMIEHLYVSRCYPLAKLKNFKKFSN